MITRLTVDPLNFMLFVTQLRAGKTLGVSLHMSDGRIIHGYIVAPHPERCSFSIVVTH